LKKAPEEAPATVAKKTLEDPTASGLKKATALAAKSGLTGGLKKPELTKAAPAEKKEEPASVKKEDSSTQKKPALPKFGGKAVAKEEEKQTLSGPPSGVS